MGHHYNKVIAIGRNREEALARAWSDFLYENGHRHSERGVESARMIRKVPPQKEVRESRRGRGFGYGPAQYTVMVKMIDDPDAPPDKWLEEWEFELHTHA
jgi:hypothetical protein